MTSLPTLVGFGTEAFQKKKKNSEKIRRKKEKKRNKCSAEKIKAKISFLYFMRLSGILKKRGCMRVEFELKSLSEFGCL